MSKVTHLAPAVYVLGGITGGAANAELTVTGISVGDRICSAASDVGDVYKAEDFKLVTEAGKVVCTKDTTGKTLVFVIAYPDARGYTGVERT